MTHADVRQPARYDAPDDVRYETYPVVRDVHADAPTLARIRATFWTIGIVLGAFQAIIFRNWVNGDAISYFDMSDAVATTDWHRLVNGAWSPLYPFVVGVANVLLAPSRAWQFPVAHLVNFLCFLFAFAGFELLLREIMRTLERDAVPHLPRWAIMAVGYMIFLWGTLGILSLIKPTPDMLMSGFLYLGVALVLRIARDGGTTRTYLLLGVVLALGYFAKAIMFPLGIIMLAATIVARHDRRALARAVVAIATFAVVSAPYVAAESRLQHHLTFGDAAKVVHLNYLDGLGPYGETLGHATGRSVHRMRQIFTTPPAFEFSRPIVATYPYWYDPTYWVDGLRPGFDLQVQLHTLVIGIKVYAHILLETFGMLLVAFALVLSAGWRRSLPTMLTLWPVWIVALAALGAYALVHVEERYVGALFVLMWLAVFLPLPYVLRGERALLTVVGIAVLTLAASTAYQMRVDIDRELSKAGYGEASAADALTRLGVAPGERVARVSRAVWPGWARLAHLTVIAEVNRRRTQAFWAVPQVTRDSVLRAFAAVGARAVVSDMRPGVVPPRGWRRLGDSWFAVYLEPSGTPTIARR